MGGAVLALNLKLKAAAAAGTAGASPTAASSAGGTFAAVDTTSSSSNRKTSTQADGSSSANVDSSGGTSTVLPGDIDPPDLDAMGPMATVWSEVDTQQFIDITEESIVPVVSLDTEPAGSC
jgi:hypothetical protein